MIIPGAAERSETHDAGRLLFALAAGAERHPTAASSGSLWPQLLLLAQREQALIALHEHCTANRSLLDRPEWAHRLALLLLDAQRRMHAVQRRIEETVVTLNRHGVTPLLLKGAGLSATAYGGWNRRSMRDIDLLVAPSEVDAARIAAAEAGWVADTSLPADDAYHTHHHTPPLLDGRGSGLRLEIHRSLLAPGHPFDVAHDEIRTAARVVNVGASRALVMDPTHHVLHLAIHFMWSHEGRVGAWNAFSDLHALQRAENLDWPAIVSAAERWRARSCLYWTLRLAHSLSGFSVATEVLDELAPARSPLMLDRLERHFCSLLLDVDADRQALRLERTLWSAAIRPQQQGHGASRPWSVSGELRIARGESAHEPEPSHFRKLSQLRRSLAYLTKLV